MTSQVEPVEGAVDAEVEEHREDINEKYLPYGEDISRLNHM